MRSTCTLGIQIQSFQAQHYLPLSGVWDTDARPARMHASGKMSRVRMQLVIIHWSIYSFCQDTFPRCPIVIHKEVMVRCPICSNQKTGKKGTKKQKTVCDHENRRTFKRRSPWQRGHCMFANGWLLCRGQFKFAKDPPKISQLFHLILLKCFLRFNCTWR